MERYWLANGILASNECGGLVMYDDAQRALDAEREKAKQLAKELAALCSRAQAQLRQVEGEQMEHEELVRHIAKSGQEIKDSLSAKDLDLWHHATGCATEAGELLDAAKKVAIYNKPVDRENVIEELGDLEFYMQGIRANLGITREECLAHNIAKLTKRYPKGTFDNADAVARADKHGEQDH